MNRHLYTTLFLSTLGATPSGATASPQGQKPKKLHSILPKSLHSRLPLTGLPKNEKRNQLVYLQDMVPTIYEMLGIEKPSQMQFVSQLNVLKNGNSLSNRTAVYGAYLNKQRMIRNDRYKLFFIVDAQKVMLFDLLEDPDELNDLYGTNKKYDKIAKAMAKEYLVLAKEAGDKLDLSTYFPELFK